jgi:choline dehydrogenase
MHTLVTRILFAPAEGDACRRAVGVELMEGEHLYGADPNAVAGSAEPRRRLRARREVILCGGAFNSPQLLMLSGIGDPEELKRHGIEIVVDLPGVGQNLQDRYEVGVVCRTHGEFALTRGATFDGPAPGEPPDPLFAQWLEGKGPYATNGGLIALTKRSGLTPEPDLFIFCVPGDFHGYYRGRTDDNAYTKSRFSWVILKSHTTNRDGRVRLRSADPREPPDISFRYFHEGSPGWEGDLAAVAHAVEFVRHLNAKLTCILAEETVPGADVTGDRLRRFIRDEAWGHHASCTNRMGRRCDRYAVVDSEFRVMHTSGLRVVDASVFPEIPGFFITTSIYMIAEKASELILADAARGPPPAEECAEGAQGRVP